LAKLVKRKVKNEMEAANGGDGNFGESHYELFLLASFALAMALLEAAVVVYMRQLYYPDNPLELFPLRFLDHYDPILELSREASTIVMLLTVALLAQRGSLTRKFAGFVFVFGLWDLAYYFWLKVLIGWPRSWWEWDVLFLIPGVWLGPWICPALIALLFVMWGFWVLSSKRDFHLKGWNLALFVLGAAVGLLTFLQPATSFALEFGKAALSEYVPGEFWWWMFIPSYLLMATGLARAMWPQPA